LGIAGYLQLPQSQSKDSSTVKGARANAIESATTYLITQNQALQSLAMIQARLRPLISNQNAPTDAGTLLNQLISTRLILLNIQKSSVAWTVPETAKLSQVAFEKSIGSTLTAVDGYFDLVNSWSDPNLGKYSQVLDARQAFTNGEESLVNTKRSNTQMLSQAGEKFIDTDSDDLPDIWERVAGSDITLKDTDEDGLSDAQEFNTWLTSPTNPDTDADGYTDAIEVTSGYDPLGPGKLTFTTPK
jgi:hypothetical protein